MSSDDFTVLLAKSEPFKADGVEIGGKALFGRPMFREGKTGVADSVEAVQTQGLVQVPTYMLVNGRAHADRESPVWSQWHDTYAERDTVHDEKGILGNKGVDYVIDIQNGGLFMGDHQKIRDAVEGGRLVNRAMPLDQAEVDILLEAVKTGSADTLREKGWVKAENVYVFNGFQNFDDASADLNLTGDWPAYVVARTAEDARANSSGYRALTEQIDNPDLIIPAGGRKPLQSMLTQAESFKWKKIGSHHDGYGNKNSGRVVFLSYDVVGVTCDYGVGYGGWSVGVAPEALRAFNNETSMSPIELKVLEADRTKRPFELNGTVYAPVPGVALVE